MSCPCANYYVSFHTWLEVQSINREEGSIKCPNRVQIFGGYCDICLVCLSQAQLSRFHADPECVLDRMHWNTHEEFVTICLVSIQRCQSHERDGLGE
jgi:hypothetical protein